jgi:hypothetical protein
MRFLLLPTAQCAIVRLLVAEIELCDGSSFGCRLDWRHWNLEKSPARAGPSNREWGACPPPALVCRQACPNLGQQQAARRVVRRDFLIGRHSFYRIHVTPDAPRYAPSRSAPRGPPCGALHCAPPPIRRAGCDRSRARKAEWPMTDYRVVAGNRLQPPSPTTSFAACLLSPSGPSRMHLRGVASENSIRRRDGSSRIRT